MTPPVVLASSSLGTLARIGEGGPLVYLHVGHHGPGTGAGGPAGDEWVLACLYASVAADLLWSLYGICCLLDLRGLGYKGASAPVVVSVDDADPLLYVQCHWNAGLPAGSGDHGLVFWDRRSRVGPRLAPPVARALSSGLGRVVHPYPSSQHGYTRIHPCIQSIGPPALLVEPGFLERPQDARRTGGALADGIAAALDVLRSPAPG